jgi:ssDNA-binding Zn-finger/Zn-ribbon topoisomerase 1
MKTLIILMFLVVSSTSIFAQKDKAAKQKTEQASTASVQYSCPMHHDVISNGAGTCTKCGKQLVAIDRVSSKQGRVVYTCSMHPDVVANEAGKCPICGMDLDAKKGNSGHSK